MASETSFRPPKLQKRTLKGHHKAVLCIAHSSERVAYTPKSKADVDANLNTGNPSLLLSGAEDGTARLWDLRTRKTAYCMILPKVGGEIMEVTSVAFHPSILSNESQEDSSTSHPNDLVSQGLRDCTVYAAASNHVYGYDLRYHSSPSTTQTTTKPSPIITSPHFDLSNHFECTDEINQLSFSFPKHNATKKEYFMAAACDSGDVHVCQNIPHKQSQQQSKNQNTKILHHADPESQAIASCSVFRPRVNDLLLASSGTDCTVKLWDLNKPRRPIYTVTIKPEADTQNSTQLCNPPFVHSLSWSPSGRYLAAGLGDGSCLILGAEGRKLVEYGKLNQEGGHTAPVAAVYFPCFNLARDASKKAMLHGTVDDRLLISAGNDEKILFWDLGKDMIGVDASDPTAYMSKTDESGAHGEINSKLNTISIDTSNEDIPNDLLPSPSKVLFQIPHKNKANWICSQSGNPSSPCSLFVADTSNEISLYSFNL